MHIVCSSSSSVSQRRKPHHMKKESDREKELYISDDDYIHSLGSGPLLFAFSSTVALLTTACLSVHQQHHHRVYGEWGEKKSDATREEWWTKLRRMMMTMINFHDFTLSLLLCTTCKRTTFIMFLAHSLFLSSPLASCQLMLISQLTTTDNVYRSFVESSSALKIPCICERERVAK